MKLTCRRSFARQLAALVAFTVVAFGTMAPLMAAPFTADPRLREVIYDPNRVVVVPVKRGAVTLIVLDADESIAEVASGLGADCARPETAWCVAAQAGGRTLFVKPKSTASEVNNLAVVTTRRIHNFRFEVLADRDPKPPVYRLIVRAPVPLASAPSAQAIRPLPPLDLRPIPTPPTTEQVIAERLQARPQVVNSLYVLADAPGSQDILPSLVFDDGRFTYIRFPGNREVPAVFQVLSDGSETLVNTRMDDDLIVVDRVCRRLMLRAGTAAVGLWNEAFDLEGAPPQGGTTVPGVQRVLKPAQARADFPGFGAAP